MMLGEITLRKLILSSLVAAALCATAHSRVAPAQAPEGVFEYDRKAPLDVKQVSVKERGGVKLFDITFASPKGGRVPAYLIVPPGKGPFAGIVFQHWGLGDRSSFLPDALLLAETGAVSLLIDAPFRRPEPWRKDYDSDWSKPENDRDMYIQTVVDLRRALDLLSARADVDVRRIAYIGLSFGAHMGGILAAVEKRFKAFVLMGGLVSLSETFRTSDSPDLVNLRKQMPKERFDKYIEVTGPVDAIHFVGRAAPGSVLLQFARHDRFVPEGVAMQFVRAVREPRLVKWYDVGHEFNDVDSLRDRAGWLSEQIGIGPVRPALRRRLGPGDGGPDNRGSKN